MLCRIRHNSSVPDLSFPIALIVCQIESEEFQYQGQLEVGNMRGEKEQGEMANVVWTKLVKMWLLYPLRL